MYFPLFHGYQGLVRQLYKEIIIKQCNQYNNTYNYYTKNESDLSVRW